MPYGKYYSKIEKELANLTQAEYEEIQHILTKLHNIIGYHDGIGKPRFPETAKHLDKIDRAITFLEYDHGGIFDW